jgi:ATP-dependent DNA ligase
MTNPKMSVTDAVNWMKGHKALDKWPKQPEMIRRVEVKHDGWRIVIFRSGGVIQAVTRKGDNIWPKIGSRFPELTQIKGEWALDGELTTVGPASQVPTAIKKMDWPLTYHPFFVIRWNEEPVANNWVSQQIHLDSFYHPDGAVLPVCEADFTTVDRESLLSNARLNGMEGYVLKETPAGPWYKVKPTYECDMIVKSVFMGSGRNVGRAGALLCVFNDHDQFAVKVGGGLTDAMRKDWWDERADHIGSVITVRFQSVQKNSLQFPQFVRVREDKPADECSIQQLEGIRRA